MPHIEVLANSTSIRAPGYTLVPDHGQGTVQAAIQPTAGRNKRGTRFAGVAGADTTVAQQNAVLKHLADLDKDSQRDVQIAVPSKQRDSAGKVQKKTTTNVRRILMSQKTFANHLADEEAFLALQHQHPSSATPRVPALKLSRSTPNVKRSSTSEEQSTHGEASQTGTRRAGRNVSRGTRDALDDEPLLKSQVPSAPSEEVMEALLSGPPLSYNAARAAPPPSGKPQRHFCEICGYWGTIKCMKCGTRVCGLECKGAHDDGRCLKFYA
ncbi:MAG: hypothetical protein ASARMPRED_001661 [Alectoria sarmentosa]|nr:MAG: hypothetical protein ASARMPRED_001661 [Alectoria sarmentosa]